jgi:hypothetical protein
MMKLIIAQWIVAAVIVLVGRVLAVRTKRAVIASVPLTDHQTTKAKAPLWSKTVKHSLVLSAIYMVGYSYLKLNYVAEKEGWFTSADESRSDTWMMIVGHMIITLPRVFFLVFAVAFFLGLRRSWQKP